MNDDRRPPREGQKRPGARTAGPSGRARPSSSGPGRGDSRRGEGPSSGGSQSGGRSSGGKSSGPKSGGGAKGGRPMGGRPSGDRSSGGRGRDDDHAAPQGPIRVGGARNEFGTRVAKRISCTRCGKTDHIPHPPRKSKSVLCRDCAKAVLEIYEVGETIRKKMIAAKCIICDTPFSLPEQFDPEESLCPDCLRGFAGWQGRLETDFEERRVAEPRRTGVRLRRPTDEGNGT